MLENTKNIHHSFASEERQGVKLSGVSDVISFDENTVICETVCGNMAVEGEGLHITVLNIDEGRVSIDGRINALYYFDPSTSAKKKLFGKK